MYRLCLYRLSTDICKRRKPIIVKQREKSPELAETVSNTTPEIHGNASSFTVYAMVRQSVLVQGIRDASRVYHLANSGAASDTESDEDADEKNLLFPSLVLI